MEKAVSTINQFNYTKTQISDFVEKVLTEIDNENPLDIIPKIKVMEEITKQIKSKINHNLMLEVSKYPEKTFIIDGVKFTKVNRKSYNYSSSEKHQQLKSEIKELETLMQTIKMPIADAGTGELIYPATFKESESVSITLKLG